MPPPAGEWWWRGWGRHGLWLITSCGMSSEQCTATTTCRRGTIMCRPVLCYKHWILSKLSFNISFPHLQKYFWWDHYFVEARQCSIKLRPSDQGRVPWGWVAASEDRYNSLDTSWRWRGNYNRDLPRAEISLSQITHHHWDLQTLLVSFR